MSVIIKLKRGLLNNVLSHLDEDGELIISTDTSELFMTNNGQKQLVSKYMLVDKNESLPNQHVQGRLIYDTNLSDSFIDTGYDFKYITNIDGANKYNNSVISGETDERNDPIYLQFNNDNFTVSIPKSILVNINGRLYEINKIDDIQIKNYSSHTRYFIFIKIEDLSTHYFTLEYSDKKPFYNEIDPLKLGYSPGQFDKWYDLKKSRMYFWKDDKWIDYNGFNCGYIELDRPFSYRFRNIYTKIFYASRNNIYKFNPQLPHDPSYIVTFSTDELDKPWAQIEGDYNRYTSIIQNISYDAITVAVPRYAFNVRARVRGERYPYRTNYGFMKIVAKTDL